jgi:transcriptional regulator with XRE-family HTH domain
MTTIGDNVRSARVRANLRQEDLAAKLGVTQGYVSKIEMGLATPDANFVRSIARACDTTVARLYGEIVSEEAAPYNARRAPSIAVVGEVDAKTADAAVRSLELGRGGKSAPGECALVVRGDGLSPFAEDGDKIIIDVDKPPVNGRMCLVRMKRGKKRGAFIRKYVEGERDAVFLLPPAGSGRPMLIKKSDAEFIRVVGVRYGG